MKIVGIIAEYNPFHNGHQYHIEEALKITGSDAAIVVMSGDFVQRGAPAIMPKHLRADAALRGGAALVLELPVCYATGSAEHFAYGAVSLLEKLGCVDSICFGSECGDIASLQKIAEILFNEPEEYKQHLNLYLRQGNSFPLARQLAMNNYLNSPLADTILSEPNNILGIEYLKALYRLNSKMKAYTIKRVASGYHDDTLDEQFSSATAIRKVISSNQLASLQNQIPDSSIAFMQEFYQKRYPVFANDFSLLLKYKLLTESRDSLQEYADVSEDLANRIINKRNSYVSFEQFCEALKTKEVTYSRISRALTHVLLGIKSSSCRDIEYARILGFRKEHDRILSEIKVKGAIPLITKLASIQLDSNLAQEMLNQDIFASNLYESVITDKFHTDFISEYKHQIVIR